MKPLVLKLVAFGPFAGAEQIDFTRLGDNPLFLINGPTGAGKSSILDAICFALYGETTGKERDATQMRCDFAAANVLTEVSLDFALGTKQYRINRLPQQEKLKTRGEGTTNHPAEASLWELEDGEQGRLLVSKKVNDATAMIRELVGLDVLQFRQVMVLPQGKFREFLLADSRAREEIFSQLFQTSIYKQIERSLADKASTITKAVAHHRTKVETLLNFAGVNTEQDIVDALNELAPELAKAEATRENAKQAMQVVEREKEQALQLIKSFEDLREKKKQLTSLQAREPEIKKTQASLSRAQAAASIRPLHSYALNEAKQLTRLQEAQVASIQQKTDAELAVKLATETLSNAKDKASALDSLNKEQLELEQLQGKSARLTEANSALVAANQTLAGSTRRLAEIKQTLLELDQEQAEVALNLKTLGADLSHFTDQQIALDKLTTQLAQRQELAKVTQQEAMEVEAVTEAQQVLDVATEKLATAAESATKLEINWHQGQAALLARDLKHNEPCPVCGSTAHPMPASEGDVVEKSAVEAGRKLESDARGNVERDKEALNAASHQLTATRKDIQRLMAQLGPLAEQTLLDVQTAHDNQLQLVESLQAKQENQEALLKRAETISTSQKASNAEIEKVSSQLSQDQADQTRAQTLVEQLLTEIPEPLRAPEVLNNKLEGVVEQIKTIKTALEQAEKSMSAARSASDQAMSHHQSLVIQLQEQVAQSQDATDALTSAIHKSPFATEQEFEKALLSEEEQASLTSSIQQWQSELDSVKGAIQQLDEHIADKPVPDLTLIDSALVEKQAVFQQADDHWRERTARLKQLKDIQIQLDEANQKNQRLEAEYKIMGTLSEVANGNTGNKISLQRFVLSVLLDDVLIQASQRLSHMSKGRYQLVRKEDRAKGNKASGLELEVEDAYSGKSRSVATLSGGESFMAALSLALGLSDVVQSYAGGIKLDTLFIDEGFGSLDQESLDLAVRTLIDLQASGRMIGIISHVSELKEQMNLRLDVLSGRNGSHISTIAI